MPHPAIALIERRISANMFDQSHTLSKLQIEEMVSLATRAPTAYNLQNWRFIAVQSEAQKAKLRALAHYQAKVSAAAVTFIICGIMPDPTVIPARLRSMVETGVMPDTMPQQWQDSARLQYADPQMARDEAVRSATFGAATLLLAAEALGFVAGAMVGFDAEAVHREFGLPDDGIAVVLVAVGRAAEGNWPQKPRRSVTDVLEIL